jgi:hypothetical protein
MAGWPYAFPPRGPIRAPHPNAGGRVGIAAALLLAAWLGLGTATAQSLSRIDTRVSTDSVRIGERFQVTVVAEHEGQVEVAFPEGDAGPAVFGDLEVVERGEVQRRTRSGVQVDSVAYTVATFALDSVQVPALPVRVIANGDTTAVRAPARTATVASVVGADAEGIQGIAPPAPFPRPWWAWIVLGLVAAGLLAGAAYLWWRRRQQGAETTSSTVRPAVDQTPYEAATAWIRQLESYDLSDPDAVKPFYVELARALRVYLAREWDVAALERTTREVVEVLEDRPDVPDEAVPRIRAVLELADLVKFAEVQPAAEDHEKALREARAGLDVLEAPPAAPPSAVDGVASAADPSS